jgi:hypothetical protein
MDYVCVIADIVRSREIEKREELQGALQDTLNEVNRGSKRALASPYTITLGDEFQAVYKSCETVFADVFKILWALHPIKVRFAISRGEVATAINAKKALGMDGPAFHAARAEIEAMKEREKYQRARPDETRIALLGDKAEGRELANRALKLFTNDLNCWSDTAFACFMRLLNGDDVLAVAETLGITQRMVYKAIKANDLADHAEFIKALSNAFSGTSA